MKTALVTCFALLSLSFGCNEHIIPPNTIPTGWNAVGLFSPLDVRYMLSLNGNLYAAVIDPRVLQTEVINGVTYYVGDRSLVYVTSDGIQWTRLRSFQLDIGPMTLMNDTLCLLASDSVYQYHPSLGWRAIFRTPDRLREPSADGDMIYLNGDLYVMQTFYVNALQTFRIHRDGSFEEVFGPGGASFAGAKFFTNTGVSGPPAYLRPHWAVGGFYAFDGTTFTPLTTGLTDAEMQSSPTNSMALSHDTLFAGFKSPGAIQFMNGGGWALFGDTLPYSKIAYQVVPVLRTEPTAITFSSDRMFVATQAVGVLEWKQGVGWESISHGLIAGHLPGVESDDLYQPVVFLEHVGTKLISAYGKPGYAPWGGTGVYTYDLSK